MGLVQPPSPAAQTLVSLLSRRATARTDACREDGETARLLCPVAAGPEPAPLAESDGDWPKRCLSAASGSDWLGSRDSAGSEIDRLSRTSMGSVSDCARSDGDLRRLVRPFASPRPCSDIRAAEAAIRDFVTASCREEAPTDAIDAVLARVPAAVRLDNFGTAPTVGTYAPSLIPISGLAQSLYGMIMSGVIFNRSRQAYALLQSQAEALKGARRDLISALRRAESGKRHAEAAAVLRTHLAAVHAQEMNIALAQRRAFNNMSMPGGVRMVAGAAIFSLGIERAPTVVGAAAMLPSLAGVVLGSVGGGLLAVFGVVWLGRNGVGAWRAWRTPTYGQAAMLGASDALQTYLRHCNRHTYQRRAYNSINTLAALAYIGAAVTLVLASNGIASIPMAALPAVAVASTTSLVSELSLGSRMVPHNAQTPHLDRIALRRLEYRVHLLAMLVQQRRAQARVRAEVIARLPKHHKQGRSVHPKRWWTAVPKRWRYKAWRLLPTGERRLGTWCNKDLRRTDAPMLAYLRVCNELEIMTLAEKLRGQHAALQPAGAEMLAAGRDPDGERDPDVHALIKRVAAGIRMERQRLQAMHALRACLDDLVPHIGDVRDDPDLRIKWNAARVAFLATHRLEYHFFQQRHVKRHPDLFDCVWAPRRIFPGRDLARVRITERALEHAVEHFDAAMEGRFANLLLTPILVDYEITALRGIDEDARRTDKREVEAQLAALKAKAS